MPREPVLYAIRLFSEVRFQTAQKCFPIFWTSNKADANGVFIIHATRPYVNYEYPVLPLLIVDELQHHANIESNMEAGEMDLDMAPF